MDDPFRHARPDERDADRAKVLRTFVGADGSIAQLPAKASKRLVVLDHVAQGFDIGRRYPEREVNKILERYHADFASLRRYLVDAGFLERAESIYWRAGGTVDV